MIISSHVTSVNTDDNAPNPIGNVLLIENIPDMDTAIPEQIPNNNTAGFNDSAITSFGTVSPSDNPGISDNVDTSGSRLLINANVITMDMGDAIMPTETCHHSTSEFCLGIYGKTHHLCKFAQCGGIYPA